MPRSNLNARAQRTTMGPVSVDGTSKVNRSTLQVSTVSVVLTLPLLRRLPSLLKVLVRLLHQLKLPRLLVILRLQRQPRQLLPRQLLRQPLLKQQLLPRPGVRIETFFTAFFPLLSKNEKWFLSFSTLETDRNR